MKKTLAILLAALLLVSSLVGCGAAQEDVKDKVEETPIETVSPSPEPTQEALSTLQIVYEWILRNGTPSSSVIYSAWDEEVLMVTYKQLEGMSVSVGIVKDNEAYNATLLFDITISLPGQGDGTITIVCVEGKDEYNITYNKVVGKNTTAFGKLNPQSYEIAFESVSYTTEDKLRPGLLTFIKMALPMIDSLFAENSFSYTYEDFGFSSKILDMEIEFAKAEPAPIEIKNLKLDFNRAGTAQAYIQFANTSDKAIVVFDFYVKCYDAYGEVVKGYNRYDYYTGTFDDPLAPGKTSPSNWRWDMFGFDNTKTFEVAVFKYKLEGEDTVEIPDSQLVWVKMG
ncbi:MAG: hypothetical protein FWE69_01990 [Clostridiales bacterium]|nr:hypothetical protein [Clostridiales bacterium]